MRRRCPDNLPDGYRVTIRLKALPTSDTKGQVMANGLDYIIPCFAFLTKMGMLFNGSLQNLKTSTKSLKCLLI